MNKNQAKKFIDERRDLGREFVEAGRRQGAWAGIERLVTDELYPDQSHFIYELLQNAEDAGATRITFELHDDFLKVTHNGNRLFTKDDVTGITSIGQSQKREEINSIGKFGVGFKSVFAYTKAPHIVSGAYSFSINDLIVPTWNGNFDEIDSDQTAFILPFDRNSKSASQCFKEIANALDSLPASTILFLSSLNEISWIVSGKKNGVIRKEVADKLQNFQNPLCEILKITCQASSGKTKKTLWIRFENPLEDQNGLTCSIAYLLESKPRKGPKSNKEELIEAELGNNSLSIVPLSKPGLLHIFFPAGKEPTGLYYHMHAPFAATVDRATIPFEHEGNRFLMQQLAMLSVKSLAIIKDLGFLKPTFLGVLPNSRDELHEFYHVVRENIIAAFQCEELLPTHYRGYAKSTDVIYGPRDLRDFFLDDDLKRLFDSPMAVWCPGFSTSSRAYSFLDTLDVHEIDWEDFIDAWFTAMGEESPGPQEEIQFENWIRSMASQNDKNTDWYVGLYRLLLKAEKNRKNTWSPTDLRIRNSPVILTENNSLLRGSDVYFAKESRSIPGISVENIHPDLLHFDHQEAHEMDKETIAALSMLGVSEFDEQAAISEFVSNIGKQKSIKIDTHIEQIRCLLAWYNEGVIYDLSELKNASLFLDEICKHYHKPSKFFLDTPFRETCLSAFYSCNKNYHALWPNYAFEFDPDEFADFADAAGVHVDLPFIRKPIDGQHPERSRLYGDWGAARVTSSLINVDWVIDNLENVINRQNEETNRTLWNRLCVAPQDRFYASYAPNSSHYARSGYSSFVHQLRTHKWVLSKSGDFAAPEELDADSIADGWNLETRNNWLEVVGFGTKADKDAENLRNRTEVAEKLGVNPDLLEVLVAMPVEKQKEWLHRMKPLADYGEFPKDENVNVARRTTKAKERAQEADSVSREPRTRNVRTSGDQEAVRVYLSEKYTRDGHLFCQMSHQPMPFRLPNGNPYFEAVKLFNLDKEIEANHLCLSPTCAAEFRHALECTEENLRKAILELDIEIDNLEVTVKVPLVEHTVIKFTKSHLIDLKAAL